MSEVVPFFKTNIGAKSFSESSLANPQAAIPCVEAT